MSDTSVTRILILAAADAGRRWQAILGGPQVKVWLGRTAIPLGEHPGIILADAHAPPVIARDAAGLIRVGGGGPADVCLPADCTDDELRRTCQLLGEVVRLRLQERESAGTQRALVQAAMTDPLTGVPNRRAWDVELSRRLREPVAGQRLCLALVDLDRFKEVNDAQGHAAGDRLLQAVGRAMQETVRQSDFVARLGGDEFGLLFWVPGEAAAAAIVDRVRRRAAEPPDEALRGKITASAGFVLGGAPPAVDTAEALYLAADAALLGAKRAGRLADPG